MDGGKGKGVYCTLPARIVMIHYLRGKGYGNDRSAEFVWRFVVLP